MLVFIWSQKHGSAIVANVDSIHDEPCVPQLGLFHLSLNSRRSNVDNPGKSQIFWQAMPNKVSSLGGANARVRMSKIWRQWKILCSYRAFSSWVRRLTLMKFMSSSAVWRTPCFNAVARSTAPWNTQFSRGMSILLESQYKTDQEKKLKINYTY